MHLVNCKIAGGNLSQGKCLLPNSCSRNTLLEDVPHTLPVLHQCCSAATILFSFFFSDEWSRPIFNLTSNYKSLSREEREQRDYEQLPKRRRLRSDAKKTKQNKTHRKCAMSYEMYLSIQMTSSCVNTPILAKGESCFSSLLSSYRTFFASHLSFKSKVFCVL